MMNFAQELQNKELYIDAYLLPVMNSNDIFYQCFNEGNADNFNSLILRKQGFPVHKLLFAAASPFFRSLFKDHYFEHRESCVTILLPETSPLILYYVIHFVYTQSIDIPLSLRSEVLQLAKHLQVNSLIHKLCQNSITKSSSPLKKQLGIKYLNNVYSHSPSNLLSNEGQRINCKFSSNTDDLHSSRLKTGKGISSTTMISNAKDNADRNDNYDISTQTDEKKIPQHDDVQDSKNLFNKVTASQPVVQNSSYWMNSSSNSYIPRGLLIAEPNHKTEVVLLTNAVTTCQSFLSSSEAQDTPQNILCPNNSEFATLPLEVRQNPSSNLTLVDLPSVLASEPLTDSYSSPNVPSNTLLLPVSNADQPAIEGAKEEQPRMSFLSSSQDQVSCSDSTVAGLQLCCTQQEEEEEKLKLQVLLKECEGIDVGGRNFTERPSTPVEDPASPSSDSSTSEDFTDRINEWVHGNMLENHKGVDDGGGRVSHQTANCSSQENMSSYNTDSIIQLVKRGKETELRSSQNVQVPVAVGTECTERRGKLKNFPCKKCDVVSLSKTDFILHKKDHKKKMLKCRLCPKTFISRYRHDLLLHEARHSSPSLPCKICFKTFKLTKDLTAHLKRHESEPRFKCEMCDKRLCSRRNLRMHVAKIHEDQKPFKCEICSKLYCKQSSLKVHIRSIHTHERPYKCLSCSKAFASSELLAVHKSIHSSYFQYTCTICEKGFHSVANLYHHKKVHLKEKCFPCNICKLQFECNLTLLKHKLFHKKLSHPLKCRHCDQTFNVKASYEMHMFNIHKEKVKITEINVKQVNISTAENKTKLQISTLKKESSNTLIGAVEKSNSNSICKFIENDKIESKIEDHKLVKVIYWPSEQKVNEKNINYENSNCPSIKLNVIQTVNKKNLVKPPLSKFTSAGSRTNSSLIEDRDLTSINTLQFPINSANQSHSREIDSFLQTSDYHTVTLPLQGLPNDSAVKRNAQVCSKQELKFTGEREHFEYGGEERSLSKWKWRGSTGDYKLTDDLSLSCNTQEEGTTIDTANYVKPDSHFLVDTLSAKCSNEDNNVEKFLFDINLLSELP